MDFSFMQEAFPDLQFMPLKGKVPVLKNWQTDRTKHDISNCEAIGLVCGELSGNLLVVDVDTKYSLDGKLFTDYKRLIHAADPTLLEKMVVQKTKSGGYHLVYRCTQMFGNLKLANRPSTDDERKATFDAEYAAEIRKSTEDAVARQKAEKRAAGDRVRVLLETRGIGGQIVCSPTPGYELVHRDFYGICEITPEQQDILHSCARQLNTYFEEITSPKSKTSTKTQGLTPLDDYDQRGDVCSLLGEHGWKFVNTRGNKTHFLRPGQTTSQTSGNYDSSNNWFSVFTTSSDFEPEKGYRPAAVFAKLECNNDFSVAAKKLYEMGYGDRREEKKSSDSGSTRKIQSRISVEDDDLSFLASGDDYDDYLRQVRDGTLVMGLTTGSPNLDKHFLFKKGDFIMTNGIDNTGKSVWTWWLMLVAAMQHGWKGIIFSSENTIGAFMRKMIQFYWGLPLYGDGAMNDTQFNIARKFIQDHFFPIKAQEDLFNYKDIINMVKKARKAHNIDYGMIDPYNSLKIDLSGFSKLSTHEYHYEALSELKAYGQQTDFGWFVNHHAVTAAARAKDGEKKYPLAPNKADTEGGQKIANKADTFITIHRITQHPTDWMVTEVHIRKIKDTETGGRPTPQDDPVRFEMYKKGCGFVERVDIDGLGSQIDPIAEWHKSKGTYVQPQLFVGVDGNIGNWRPLITDTDEPPF